MEKTERETRDFMNVESFSQLPFIRPPPPLKEKNNAIRLFGKEFATTTTAAAAAAANHSHQNNNNPRDVLETNKDTSNENTENMSNRKFECHYCCRNFPTSQALGGHQNAHKRERQHAKRAHLQSALSNAHVYGLMNYSRIGSSATLPTSYHSYSANNSRFYGSPGSYSGHLPQPINGSPLGLWSTNNQHTNSSALINRERTSLPMQQHSIPLFNSTKDDKLKPFSAVSSGFGSGQIRFGYESKATMQDHHVSLDLHL